jgi:hypothetical protein
VGDRPENGGYTRVIDAIEVEATTQLEPVGGDGPHQGPDPMVGVPGVGVRQLEAALKG